MYFYFLLNLVKLCIIFLNYRMSYSKDFIKRKITIFLKTNNKINNVKTIIIVCVREHCIFLQLFVLFGLLNVKKKKTNLQIHISLIN